jgi:predicted nucleic acid-binding protein
MDRLFLDANVLVSAALKPDSRIAGLWRLRDVRLLGSPYILAEARRNVPDPAAASRLEALAGQLVVLPSEPADFEMDDDPGLPAKDRPVLLAVIVSGADFLLTGDVTHFGTCFGHTIEGVRIVLPGDYLRECGRSGEVETAHLPEARRAPLGRA